MALSQDEVANLLGAKSGAKVCRYEHFGVVPGLETALAYEAILGKPVRELFGGLYQRIEKEVVARAKKLSGRPGRLKPNQQTIRKLKTLTDIADTQSNKSLNQ